MRLLSSLSWLPGVLLGLLACAPSLADSDADNGVPAERAAAVEPQQASGETLLDTVVVTGRQPGPGLWTIRKGDHVMWVIGTLGPLPRRMQWDDVKVQARLAESQEVVLLPGARIKAKVGFFSGLMLLPKAMGARRNPDKDKLADVLPAELYARWAPLRQQYFGRSRSIEKQRPILAAHKLYERALFRAGLREIDVVTPVVRKAAKRAKLPVTEPTVDIEVADPKQALAEFAASALNDVPCFEQTLDRIQTDLGGMKARANAWAAGDLAALRELPYVDQRRACNDAVLGAQVARDRGMGDLREQVRTAWLNAAIAAIDRSTTSFGVLQMSELLREDGIGAMLAARGYEVVAP